MYRPIETSLASSDCLVAFAEGSILGVEVAFQPGAFRIARCFDLPVVITGSHRDEEHGPRRFHGAGPSLRPGPRRLVG